MAVQLSIPYETLLELVEQLPPNEQLALVQRLQQQSPQMIQSADEKMRLLKAAQLHNAVNQEPSVRRTDWYDDDGR